MAGVGIEDIEQTCLECNRTCVNRRSLGNHVARSHRKLGGLKGYVLKHFLNDQVPLCKCGCGNPVNWHKYLYHFNEYITGHNTSGYKLKDFKHSPEQIRFRNMKIKEAYRDNKDLKAKIGKSVVRAFKDPEKKKNLIDGQLRGWQDEDRKQRHSETQKRHWAEHHEERYNKVFTKEWRRKKGLENMRRNFHATSKVEKRFVEQLKTFFPEGDVVPSKWFNFTKKTWCADAWIKSLRTIVELDGSYHHDAGLTDAELKYQMQVTNRQNDRAKHQIAEEKHLNVVRIWDSDIDHISSWSDVVSSAHTIIESGKITRIPREFLHAIRK